MREYDDTLTSLRDHAYDVLIGTRYRLRYWRTVTFPWIIARRLLGRRRARINLGPFAPYDLSPKVALLHPVHTPMRALVPRQPAKGTVHEYRSDPSRN